VQAAAEALSGCYAALGRRRARILAEEMREGSGAFSVHAYLPVEASFGLADELRRKTSGAASASLMLSHWERLQVGGKGREGEGKGNGKGREGKGAGGPAGCCVCCIMLVWAGSREVGRMC
jgi:ribosome assembly protein 1